MNKQIYKDNKDTVSMIILSAAVVLINIFLHKEILPAFDLFVSMQLLAFPVAIIAYHFFYKFVTAGESRSMAKVLDQWFSLSVIPYFLLVLLSLGDDSCSLFPVFFICIYSILRIVGYIWLRQQTTPSSHIDLLDFIAFGFTLITIISTLEKQINWPYSILSMMFLLLLGYLSAYTAGVNQGKNESFGVWERTIFFAIVFCFPGLHLVQGFSWQHLSIPGALIYLAFYRSEQKWKQVAALAGALFVLGFSVIINPALLGLAVWLGVYSVGYEMQRRSDKSWLPVLSGAMVLFLGSMLISYIRLKGLLQFDVIFPFPPFTAWIGALFNSENGILPPAPWLILGIAAWLVSFNRKNSVSMILWAGFPVVLSGLILGNWILNGYPLNLSDSVFLLPCLIPFLSKSFSGKADSFLAGLIRFFVGLSLVVSLYTLCVSAWFGTVTSWSFHELLDIMANNSGFSFHEFFTRVSSNLPVFEMKMVYLTGFSLVGIILIIAGIKRSHKSCRVNSDILIFACFLGLFAWGLKSVQVWYTLDFETQDITIKPESSWSKKIDIDRLIVGVEIESRLSVSPHLSQGTPVASVTLATQDGDVNIGQLCAGIDTAEWAYDRPDVVKHIQHNRPEISRTWTVTEMNSFQYNGYAFKTIKYLNRPVKASRIDFSNLLNSSDRAIVLLSSVRLLTAANDKYHREVSTITDSEAVNLNSADRKISYHIQPPRIYQGVILDSFLENSADIEQGTSIAQISFSGQDGASRLWILKAGIDTAEWSMDRPDMKGRIHHRPAAFARSQRRSFQGESYLAHTFRSRWRWDPEFQVEEVTIMLLDDVCDNPNLQLVIKNIVLF